MKKLSAVELAILEKVGKNSEIWVQTIIDNFSEIKPHTTRHRIDSLVLNGYLSRTKRGYAVFVKITKRGLELVASTPQRESEEAP